VRTAPWTGPGQAGPQRVRSRGHRAGAPSGEATDAELIGVTAGAVGVGAAIAAKAALSRGLDRTVIIEDDSLKGPAGPSSRRCSPGGAAHRDVDLVVTGDSSVDVAAKMVPTLLAGELGWPAVAEVNELTGERARCGCSAPSRRRPGAGDLRPGCPGGGRGCRGAARTRHEGPPRGGQEAGRASRSRQPQRAREKRGADGDEHVAAGAEARKGQIIDTTDRLRPPSSWFRRCTAPGPVMASTVLPAPWPALCWLAAREKGLDSERERLDRRR